MSAGAGTIHLPAVAVAFSSQRRRVSRVALQGFLKRTRIRNKTTYNLEFKLPYISRLLSLPIEACDKEDALTIPPTRSKAPYSKVSTRASQPRTRVGWKPEDDTRLADMKRVDAQGRISMPPSLTRLQERSMFYKAQKLSCLKRPH